MKRVKDLKVGDWAMIQVPARFGSNKWVKAQLVADDAGEYMMRTDEGDRISLDGWEEAR